MNVEILYKMLLITGTTFLVVLLLTPFIKRVAIHIDAIDYPKSRKIHKTPIPRLGGVAIFLGFLFGYMVYGETSEIMNSILIGSFIIVLTGVIDDIKPLKNSVKFFGQIFAALIIVLYGDLLISNITLFGDKFSFGLFAYPLTIFFIVGCINCLNFIDGMDGLAAGISSIYFLTIGIIAILMAKFDLDFVLTFIMLGCTLGFLVYNFNPASIFMGDSGSMFLGFIIAVIALLGFKNVTLTSLIIPLLILAIPILDIIFAIIRRTLNGTPITEADKFHIHHQLLSKNLSQKEVVLIIYLVNIMFAFASLLYYFGNRDLGVILYAFLVLIVLIFVVKTNVIIEKEDSRVQKIINLFAKK